MASHWESAYTWLHQCKLDPIDYWLAILESDDVTQKHILFQENHNIHQMKFTMNAFDVLSEDTERERNKSIRNLVFSKSSLNLTVPLILSLNTAIASIGLLDIILYK